MSYTKIGGTIMMLAGLLHLMRVVMGWSLLIGGWALPAWVSVVAGVIIIWVGSQVVKK